MVKNILIAVVLAGGGTFLVSVPAEAGYMDPNTGGLLFQLLAASFAFLSGLILVFARQIRIAVARIGRFLRARFGEEPNSGPPASA